MIIKIRGKHHYGRESAAYKTILEFNGNVKINSKNKLMINLDNAQQYYALLELCRRAYADGKFNGGV